MLLCSFSRVVCASLLRAAAADRMKSITRRGETMQTNPRRIIGDLFARWRRTCARACMCSQVVCVHVFVCIAMRCEPSPNAATVDADTPTQPTACGEIIFQ